MAWPELLGEGGTLVPLLALAVCVVRRADRVIELCLRARIESRAWPTMPAWPGCS